MLLTDIAFCVRATSNAAPVVKDGAAAALLWSLVLGGSWVAIRGVTSSLPLLITTHEPPSIDLL